MPPSPGRELIWRVGTFELDPFGSDRRFVTNDAIEAPEQLGDAHRQDRLKTALRFQAFDDATPKRLPLLSGLHAGDDGAGRRDAMFDCVAANDRLTGLRLGTTALGNLVNARFLRVPGGTPYRTLARSVLRRFLGVGNPPGGRFLRVPRGTLARTLRRALGSLSLRFLSLESSS